MKFRHEWVDDVPPALRTVIARLATGNVASGGRFGPSGATVRHSESPGEVDVQ